MILSKKDVANRLREFIDENYKSITEAAKDLDITESSLRNAYLSGKSFPGFEALYQLMTKGCDLQWLFTGKENFWHIPLEMKNRIELVLRILREMYGYTEDELIIENVDAEFRNASTYIESDRMQAKRIIAHWYKYNSLDVFDLTRLSELSVFDLKWFLVGKRDLYDEIRSGFLFKYPEVSLLLELRKDPELFRKIKLYVDSITSSTSSLELDKISKEIDSIADQNSIAQTKKKED